MISYHHINLPLYLHGTSRYFKEYLNTNIVRKNMVVQCMVVQCNFFYSLLSVLKMLCKIIV